MSPNSFCKQLYKAFQMIGEKMLYPLAEKIIYPLDKLISVSSKSILDFMKV